MFKALIVILNKQYFASILEMKQREHIDIQ